MTLENFPDDQNVLMSHFPEQQSSDAADFIAMNSWPRIVQWKANMSYQITEHALANKKTLSLVLGLKQKSLLYQVLWFALRLYIFHEVFPIYPGYFIDWKRKGLTFCYNTCML